ncbi:MAG: formate--tetrahydrofolate ligase, partial [Spirochaetota bacterium]
MSVERIKPVPSDIDIAQAAKVKPIAEIAAKYGIDPKYLEMHGDDKAKVRLEFLRDNKSMPKKAKY